LLLLPLEDFLRQDGCVSFSHWNYDKDCQKSTPKKRAKSTKKKQHVK